LSSIELVVIVFFPMDDSEFVRVVREFLLAEADVIRDAGFAFDHLDEAVGVGGV
jgi:hypothetical protein